MVGRTPLGISSPSLRIWTQSSVVRLTDSQFTCHRATGRLKQSRCDMAPIASSETRSRTCWSLLTMNASRDASHGSPDRLFRPGLNSRRTTQLRMSGVCRREEPSWRVVWALLQLVWASGALSSMTRFEVARMQNPHCSATNRGTGIRTTSTRASNRRVLSSSSRQGGTTTTSPAGRSHPNRIAGQC